MVEKIRILTLIISLLMAQLTTSAPLDPVWEILEKTRAAVNNTLLYYCNNTPLLLPKNCREIINKINEYKHATYQQLFLQDNITDTDTELLLKLSITLSKYVILIENQVNIEHDSLCAPAKRIGIQCRYPYACVKPLSDALFYCYLRHTVSYVVDLDILLNLRIAKRQVTVDADLLLPKNISITICRWFTMATLHNLLEFINAMEYTLKSLPSQISD